MATRAPKFGHRGPKANLFWTLTQSLYAPSLNWIVWILFHIEVGNHHFRSFYGQERAKTWPSWATSESILNTHPISVPTKFELDCVNTFLDNGRKPPFPVICGHLRAKIWPTWPRSKSILNSHLIREHTKFELDRVNTFSVHGRKPPFWPTLSRYLATRVPKLGQRCP